MAHIRREQRRVALLRTGGIVLLSALIVGAIAVVPLATFVNVGIHNPAVVHALLNAGLWFVDIGRTLAGATQAVLRALVLGLSWPVVVGYLMIAVAMLLTWVRGGRPARPAAGRPAGLSSWLRKTRLAYCFGGAHVTYQACSGLDDFALACGHARNGREARRHDYPGQGLHPGRWPGTGRQPRRHGGQVHLQEAASSSAM
jgi:hypothetical protein